MALWVVVTLTFWTIATTQRLLVRPLKAEILSPQRPGALNFKVGSDVTLQCRLKSSYVDEADVNSMTLFRQSSNETLNVTVIDNATVQTTLPNVTLVTNDVVVCQAEPNIFVQQSLCIGDVPTNDFDIECRLHLYANFQCCVITEQRQDTFCNVIWSMTFPDRRKLHADGSSLCVTWTSVLGAHLPNISVRASASSPIGSATKIVSFVPAHNVEPGPVHDLTARAIESEAHALQVTWKRDELIHDAICEEMNLTYVIKATPPAGETLTLKVKDNCSENLVMHTTLTGLIPFMEYNVTVIPRGMAFSGPARSKLAETAQSSPLKPPMIVGWSQSALTPTSLAVYWKKFRRREMGGPIVFYEFKVKETGSRSGSGTLRFNVSRQAGDTSAKQLVTAPQVLSGCRRHCVVSVTASTLAGTSPSTDVSIVLPPADKAEIIVQTEHSNLSRIVSWEGVVNVTSVFWCFGSRYPEDASLIKCQTELQEKSVDPAERTRRRLAVAEEKLLGEDREAIRRCENCQWHFAISLPDPGHHGSRGNEVDAGAGDDGVAGGPAVGAGDGAVIKRLVWSRPKSNPEGSQTLNTYTLINWVTVAVVIPAILFISCWIWCVRRLKEKSKLFSPTHFPDLMGRENAKVFATPATSMAVESLDTKGLHFASIGDESSSELDSLFPQVSASELPSEEKGFGTYIQHPESSLPPSNAVSAGYVTTTCPVDSRERENKDGYCVSDLLLEKDAEGLSVQTSGLEDCVEAVIEAESLVLEFFPAGVKSRDLDACKCPNSDSAERTTHAGLTGSDLEYCVKNSAIKEAYLDHSFQAGMEGPDLEVCNRPGSDGARAAAVEADDTLMRPETPLPLRQEETSPYKKERTARSCSLDSGNSTDSAERPEKEQGEDEAAVSDVPQGVPPRGDGVPLTRPPKDAYVTTCWPVFERTTGALV